MSSIAGALDEDTKKSYTIDRLSDNLLDDLSSSIDKNYYKLEIEETKTIGNIEKWKNFKVQYKNLNMPLEEFVLKSVEIIKN